MWTFTLAIHCLTTSNLPWFMDLTFQVPMQYCSLQHQTLLLSPVTSTTGYCFCFCSIPSFFLQLFLHWSPALPGGSDGKASAYNAGDPGLIPGSRRSSGEGNGNPLQYSCLENPMDGGDWLATVLGVTKNWTQLSDFTIDFTIGHLLTWRVHLSVSYLFAFSCCSWGSQGKNTEVVCHSLLQWTTFCQTSPPWPSSLGWLHPAWLSFIHGTGAAAMRCSHGQEEVPHIQGKE